MHLYKLTADEREARLLELSETQREFLLNRLKRSKKTQFANFMQEEKVTAIRAADGIDLGENEQHVADWEISHFVDHGPNNRIGQCACGISLRYEFTVQHQVTKKEIRYGKHHLGTFLNLEIKEIDALLGRIEKIDHELDELLIKLEQQSFGYEFYEQLLNKDAVPKTITAHMEAEVPFTNAQIIRLQKMHMKQISTQLADIQSREKKEQALFIEETRRLVKLQEKARLDEQQRLIEAEQEKRRQLEEKTQMYQPIVEAAKNNAGSNHLIADVAYTLVLQGIHSAVEISHLIRENFQVDKRLSKGLLERPYIYFDVLSALDEYTAKGMLIKDEGSTIEDCLYYLNDGQHVDIVEEDDFIEPYQQSLF